MIAICSWITLAALPHLVLPSRAPAPDLRAHTKPVAALAFSPDGTRLASAGHDGLVCVWDVAARRKVFQLEHGRQAECVAFSPDGKMLAEGGGGDTIGLVDVASGTPTRRVKIAGPARSVAFSPDGTLVAVGLLRESLQVLDATTGEERRKLPIPDGHAFFTAFSADGKTLFSGTWTTMRAFDVGSGRLRSEIRGSHGEIYSVAMSPDATTFAAASADETVCAWDVASGKETRTMAENVRGACFLDFAPGGREVSAASWDRKLHVLRLDGEPRAIDLPPAGGRPWSVAYAPGGDAIAVGMEDGSIEILPAR